MHELTTIFPYGLNENPLNLKLIIPIITLLSSFHFCWINTVMLIVKKITKVSSLLFPEQFLNYLNHMLNFNFKNVPKFIRISLARIKDRHEINYAIVSIFFLFCIYLKYKNLCLLSLRINHLQMSIISV